jgi:spermidine synthase
MSPVEEPKPARVGVPAYTNESGVSTRVDAPQASNYPCYLLFFLSGIPALLYQIVWQRALFTIYGVNIESVTIIVTVFMLGLGLGSLAGGYVSSKRLAIPLLFLFAGIESLIGLFGAFSMMIFRTAAMFTAGAPPLETGLITFGLLLIPTMLMGSTLPLLTAHLIRRNQNVGKSVGALYSVNTFGSAAACFLAALFLMRFLGESGSVRLAAGVNALVACVAILFHFFDNPSRQSPSANVAGISVSRTTVLSFRKGLIVAAVAGFIALGYEIVWYRLYAFVSGGPASCFAYVLGWYLAGVGYGSLAVRDICCSHQLQARGASVLPVLKKAILLGSLAAFLIGPTIGVIPGLIPYPLVFIGAALLGAVFPLVSHASIEPDAPDAGTRLSYLYLSNILGCTAGSLLVGFVLMDWLPIQGIAAFLLSAGLILAFSIDFAKPVKFTFRATAIACAILLVLSAWPLYSKLYERLLTPHYGDKIRLDRVVETRSGVIAVDNTGTVYGGGMYDGRFNTDLMQDSNGIFRAFAVDAFQPNPKEVLMIGLSSGSWAQVLANNPRVERITIIEINPGYLKLIPKYPTVASVLHNPKVSVFVDDGRRWLLRNPQARFDLVVSNTSYHWRSQTSNLLSAEFLSLIRRHLKQGGIHYYNTTDSEEALFTGATVFPYALRIYNFLAVSDRPIVTDKERWRADLAAFRIDGKPVLTGAAGNKRMGELLKSIDTLDSNAGAPMASESGEHLRQRLRGRRIVSDDNMATEWAR